MINAAQDVARIEDERPDTYKNSKRTKNVPNVHDFFFSTRLPILLATQSNVPSSSTVNRCGGDGGNDGCGRVEECKENATSGGVTSTLRCDYT